jgi:hypothetical protein
MRFEAASASVLFASDDMQFGYKAIAAKEKAEFQGKLPKPISPSRSLT